ncbi:MAG: phosphate signaling complex protein PhoU, partial [Planctomycetota bacterium]|nr:phosphate signaling complex protein PhoU [Planctomycetota bacterium]
QAIGELVNRDEQLAAGIPDFERQVNSLQLEIDEKAVTLLATHQPVAGDLRLILMASRISGELERIGDLVINITENVATLVNQPQLKPLIDIPRMAEVASKMVHESLDAFLRSDVLLAQAVIMTDDRVDDLKEQILRELLTYMAADPKSIERAMALILISRHLERIADHATNIAEDVIFLIQGRDVRHPKTR